MNEDLKVAATARAMQEMDCQVVSVGVRADRMCIVHNFPWLADNDCCPHAERVALAVLEAVEDSPDPHHTYPANHPDCSACWDKQVRRALRAMPKEAGA